MVAAGERRDQPRERTAYLDTANWADLADGKLDARPLEAAVEAGAVVPVLSTTHLQEFGQRQPDSRGRLTRFIDAMRQRGKFLWISDLVTTERQELLVAYKRELGSGPALRSTWLLQQSILTCLTAAHSGATVKELRASCQGLRECVECVPSHSC